MASTKYESDSNDTSLLGQPPEFEFALKGAIKAAVLYEQLAMLL
jgi:hypothetical protein